MSRTKEPICFIVFDFVVLVGGEWTDGLSNGHPPLTPTLPVDHVVNGTPKKERFSRILTDHHPKLSKKTSSQGKVGSLP